MSSTTAEALRLAFDRSFAEARGSADQEFVELLAIRVGGERHAVRVSELASLHVDSTIAPLPSRARGLLGITGIRGAILPIFDLAILLECPRAAPARCIMIAARARVGLAFDGLDGYRRAVPASFAGTDGREAVQLDGQLCPLVSIASIVERIEQDQRGK
jgi:chemotaxis signal transduction protein